MDKKAADRDKRRQQEPERADVDVPAVSTPELIPPYYAQRDFSLAHKAQIFSQRKGDIIRDQQKLYLYKQQNQPIAVFDERMTAKCPNPKCGCVFAWDGGSKQEA